MNINLKLDDATNERKKKIGLTWRKIILAGLTSLESNPDSSGHLDANTLEPLLKQAVKSLTDAWTIIKKHKGA